MLFYSCFDLHTFFSSPHFLTLTIPLVSFFFFLHFNILSSQLILLLPLCLSPYHYCLVPYRRTFLYLSRPLSSPCTRVSFLPFAHALSNIIKECRIWNPLLQSSPDVTTALPSLRQDGVWWCPSLSARLRPS